MKYTQIGDVQLARHRDRIAMFIESGRGPFEPDTLAHWRTICLADGPSSCVLDVGAYTGLFSIVAAKAGCEVIAVEPHEKALHRMRHNLRHNGVQDDVVVVEAAASAFRGDGRLEIGGTERLGISSTSKLREGEGVTVCTLDDIVRAIATAPVRAIKIDVEGHELAALTGATEILERDHPALLIEVDSGSGGDREAEVTAFLSTFGYQEGARLDGRNRFYLPD